MSFIDESIATSVEQQNNPFERVIETINQEIQQKIRPDASIQLKLMDGSVAKDIFNRKNPLAANVFFDYIFTFDNQSMRARLGMASYSTEFPIYIKSKARFIYKRKNAEDEIVQINNVNELNQYFKLLLNSDFVKKLFYLTKKGRFEQA